jgi:hypothetical protein
MSDTVFPCFQALLFYGSDIAVDDMPRYNQLEGVSNEQPLWCLLHEESPRNIALLQHNSALSLFNLSATFSRYSDFPLTLQYLPDIARITGWYILFIIRFNLYK